MPWGFRMVLSFEPRYYAQQMTIAIAGIPNAMIAKMERSWFQ